MQQIKGYTSKILREEFKQLSKMPSLWTRSYFVSTAGNVCSETIKQYVENQKKRYWYDKRRTSITIWWDRKRIKKIKLKSE